MAMKFDSPIYDRIRVKPDMDRRVRAQCPGCEWTGCANAATHRAPKGRGKEHEYWRFCLDHVREYNSSYNFFAGMTDEAVARYQKDAITGHRPTWKMGTGGRSARERMSGFDATDPFDVGQEFGATGRNRAEQQRGETRAGRKSRPGSKRWSSVTIPTQTAAARPPRTSCARSSKLTII